MPRGRIQLEDGRTLPPNYRSFAHGYAVTAHRSQGKTVDSVILSGDGMQKELFYVAASRGRHSVTVITSDKERLQQTVGRSMARTSATELLRGQGRVLASRSSARDGNGTRNGSKSGGVAEFRFKADYPARSSSTPTAKGAQT